MPMPPCEILEVGRTSKTEAQLTAFLSSITNQFTAATYDLLNHNCNHFSNAVVRFLSDGTAAVPDRIVNIANEALSTPQGQALRRIIEGMQQQMNNNNAGNHFNPLGHVPSATSSVPAASTAAAATPAATPAAGGEQLNLDSLRAALVTIDTAPVEARRACLTTVAKLGGNIVEHPEDTKYRKIRSANGAFSKKVAGCTGGVDLMRALGFGPQLVEHEEHWVWAIAVNGTEETSLRFLKVKVGVVNKKLSTLPAPPPPTPAPAPAAPPPTAMPGLGGMGMGGMGGLPGMGGGMPAGLNPQMMAQAQQMMQNNPGMLAQAQQMMQNNPQMMAQAQQMMNDPAQMQQLMQMMNQGGGGGFGGGGMGGGMPPFGGMGGGPFGGM